jgi:hypothetical protein
MPTPTYTPLANITLGSSASFVTFSSIPTTYRDLVLVIDGSGSTSVEQLIYFNNDIASNYSSVRMFGTGSSRGRDSSSLGRIGNSYGSRTSTRVQIMDYSVTNKHKIYLARNDSPANIVLMEAGRWINTAAIGTIRVQPASGTYNSGTTFSLYGILA